MFAPQVVAGIVFEQAARLRPGESLEILQEMGFDGMTKGSALSGYVKGFTESSKGGVDWPGLVSDLQGIMTLPDLHLVQADVRTAHAVAGRWAREDFNAALDWFTKGSGLDFSKQSDAGRIASVLGSVPDQQRYQAVDWIDENRGLPDWDNAVIGYYGKSLVARSTSLGPEVERLVGFLANENERVELVQQFMVPLKRGVVPEFRFSREDLRGLVHAANLSEERTSDFLNTIALGKGRGSE